MTFLSMSSRSSVDRALARWSWVRFLSTKDSDFIFVPLLYHIDQFTFHISILLNEWKGDCKFKPEAATPSSHFASIWSRKVCFFLSGKSQGILKSDVFGNHVCGNVKISNCLKLELMILLFLLTSSGQYFRLTMNSHGWLWMLLTATDVPVYPSICICYANFTTLFLCCWKINLCNKVTEPSSLHVHLQVFLYLVL